MSKSSNEQRRRRSWRKWLQRKADEQREALATLAAELHREWRQQGAPSAQGTTDSGEVIPPEVL